MHYNSTIALSIYIQVYSYQLLIQCSYGAGGVTAILEFYFTHFLYVCLGKLAIGLGTASTNLFIALNQLSGLSGGFQADKFFGMVSK